MNFINQFIGRIAAILAIAIAGLFVSGLLLTLVQGSRYYGRTFFSYEVRLFDYTPAWFIYLLILLIINGWYIYRWAVLSGGVGTPRQGPWGYYDVNIPLPPLKVAAVNLITVPALILSFMVIRSVNL